MKKIKFYLSSVSFAALGALLLGASSAQAALPQQFGGQNIAPIVPSDGNLLDLASKMVDTILIIISVVAVLYLIYGGIQYITAGGDADKASKGRVTITNAIIGIIIIIAAFAIYRFAASVGDATPTI
jgi:hypothetical protein